MQRRHCNDTVTSRDEVEVIRIGDRKSREVEVRRLSCYYHAQRDSFRTSLVI